MEVTDSRLLTNKEVENLTVNNTTSFFENICNITANATYYDTEEKYRLKITLTRVDFGDGEYYFMGTASWNGIEPSFF